MRRLAAIAGMVCSISLHGQTARAGNVPAQIVVSVGHVYGNQPPLIGREHLKITQQIDTLPIVRVTPLRGDRAALELYITVDQCSDCDPGSKVAELRRFIGAQPATTSVGVAYIQSGEIRIAETPSPDHERAMNALNAPSGSKPASPFRALAELIRGWPKGSARRAVVMISNGFDPAVQDNAPDPNAESAIEEAQRAGITVYAIYHPSADYTARDFTKLYAGQVQLAHVADETGGEAYFTTFGPLPSLAPFLADIATHLANQYLVEFLVPPANGAGALKDFTVKCMLPDVQVVAPYKAWVAGRPVSEKRP
ncbi:MAG TPA: hypothetical protein VMT15_02005 [Bryobacteraceae bacterium]|nr:hypothetical protein [Bryobacteraceae bacterium]